MINIVLYQPKIPQNTGNIIRFCANMLLQLHIVHPIGFTWDDKRLRRAGLDYAEFVSILHYPSWQDFYSQHSHDTLWLLTTKGQSITGNQFNDHDYLIFGSEDSGVEIKDMLTIGESNWLRLPMAKNSRSMNLSNTVAIAGFEAMRQINFTNLS